MKNIPDWYIDFVKETRKYPQTHSMSYPVLGLIGELGEISTVLKKMTFNLQKIQDVNEQLLSEIGDLLWYIVAYAIEHSVLYPYYEDIRIIEVPEPNNNYIIYDEVFWWFLSLTNATNSLVQEKSYVTVTLEISNVLSHINQFVSKLGKDIDSIMLENMNKINKRMKNKEKQFAEGNYE